MPPKNLSAIIAQRKRERAGLSNPQSGGSAGTSASIQPVPSERVISTQPQAVIDVVAPLPEDEKRKKQPTDASSTASKRARLSDSSNGDFEASLAPPSPPPSPVSLVPVLKDRAVNSSDSTMTNAEVAAAVVRASILPADASRYAELSDSSIFNQAIHFSLVGIQSAMVGVRRHAMVLEAAERLKQLKASMAEKLKTAEEKGAASEATVTEMSKELQIINGNLTKATAEIAKLKEERSKLEAELSATKDSVTVAVKAEHDKVWAEMDASYMKQLLDLENVFFKDGWSAAMVAAQVPEDSALFREVPLPNPEVLVPEEQAPRDGQSTGTGTIT